MKELKGFKKVTLAAGEAQEINFTITEAELAYWNSERIYKAEPGEFKVYIGASSRDVKEASFELLP
ncbi:Periplasmic beta-glucosidase precursor [compost metagenome]